MSPSEWKDLEERNAVAYCKICGKRIWKFWHIGQDKIFPEMDKCAPCLFEIETITPVKKISKAKQEQYKILLEELVGEFSSQEK